MFHAEWLQQIDAVIKELPEAARLRVLDLGCGDAALFGGLLERHNVAAYVGYDTSAEVLQYAAASLQTLAAPNRLVNDFLQRSVINETTPFNCIYSSYAIHHLQEEEKIQFFTAAYHQLPSNGGVFIYVDVCRKDGEPLNEYLDAYMQQVATKWTVLDSDEFNLVEEHIRSYDFPTEKGKLKQLLTGIGFTVTEPLVIDGVHSMLVLTK